MRAAFVAVLALLVVGCGSAKTPSPPGTAEAPTTIESTSELAPSPSLPSSHETVTPEPAIAATPMPSLTPVPPIMFQAGDFAVTVASDLMVRSQPRVSDDSIMYFPTLAIWTEMSVLDGPVFASGYWWYRVAPFTVTYEGVSPSQAPISFGDHITSGWVAAADHDGTPWIGTGGCDTGPFDPNATMPPGTMPC